MGNIASVDLVSGTVIEDNNGEIKSDGYIMSPEYIQGNSGFRLGPLGYDYYSETSFERKFHDSHSVSLWGLNIYNSDNTKRNFSFSASVECIFGLRFDLKVCY